MKANSSTNFNKNKKATIDIAKDLCYNKSVIEKLNAATNEAELTAIMNGARKRWK